MLMMLPFEAPTIFEALNKSYFRMPRVVKDQRHKFEADELFRSLASHESQVKYTGFKDRPIEERRMKFLANCQEGHTEISVISSGFQFTLMFSPYNKELCDFEKELGKVHIRSGFILNGVCVLWRGWIDVQRLEGFGCLEFDECRAFLEDAMSKQQIDKQVALGMSCGDSAPLATHNGGPSVRPFAAHLPPNPFAVATSVAAGGGAHNGLMGAPQPPASLLNPACLGGPASVPVSMADAAIVAAYQQALGGQGACGVPGSLAQPPPPPPPPASLQRQPQGHMRELVQRGITN